MRRIPLVLGSLFATLLAAPAVALYVESQDRARVRACANNLLQLLKMQGNYMVQFGGVQKLMPQETGHDFWLKLSKVGLIDAGLADIYECPVENFKEPLGTTDYRGPASNVNRYRDADPVGADVDGNHGPGRGGNVLRKSGDVQTVSAASALWLAGSWKLTGGSPARYRKQDDRAETKKKIMKTVEKVLDRLFELGEEAEKGLRALFEKRGSKSGMAANERNASAALRTLVTAQADFRSNDRDLNRVNDFWTLDVAGLYAIDNSLVAPRAPQPIKLIEVSIALADYAPNKGGALSNGNYAHPIGKYGVRAPKAGYWFRALAHDRSPGKGPIRYRQNTDGSGDLAHNTSRFGFVAFPADYGKTGRRTFIVNEGNTIFWRDLGGKTIEDWPTNQELARDWKKLE